jgi:hypothetical protein
MCRIGFGPKSGMGNWGAGEGKRMSRCRWKSILVEGKRKEKGKEGSGGGEEERKKENTRRRKR